MSEGIQRSCIDCAVTQCDAHGDRPYPGFCPSQALGAEQREAALARYLDDPEDQKLAQVAAEVEAAGYRQWPRVRETVEFARRMGFHKIGIATCVGLIRESRTLAKILRANGFEVYGVGCKVGELAKDALGVFIKEAVVAHAQAHDDVQLRPRLVEQLRLQHRVTGDVAGAVVLRGDEIGRASCRERV